MFYRSYSTCRCISDVFVERKVISASYSSAILKLLHIVFLIVFIFKRIYACGKDSKCSKGIQKMLSFHLPLQDPSFTIFHFRDNRITSFLCFLLKIWCMYECHMYVCVKGSVFPSFSFFRQLVPYCRHCSASCFFRFIVYRGGRTISAPRVLSPTF